MDDEGKISRCGSFAAASMMKLNIPALCTHLAQTVYMC